MLAGEKSIAGNNSLCLDHLDFKPPIDKPASKLTK